MEISTNQPIYVVPEDIGLLDIWISVTSGQIAPGQEWQFTVETANGGAIGELKGSVLPGAHAAHQTFCGLMSACCYKENFL